jgi:hypothetical protein
MVSEIVASALLSRETVIVSQSGPLRTDSFQHALSLSPHLKHSSYVPPSG